MSILNYFTPLKKEKANFQTNNPIQFQKDKVDIRSLSDTNLKGVDTLDIVSTGNEITSLIFEIEGLLDQSNLI